MPTQSSIRSTYRKHLLNIPENIKKNSGSAHSSLHHRNLSQNRNS